MSLVFSKDYQVEIPEFGGSKSGIAMCQSCHGGLSGGMDCRDISSPNITTAAATGKGLGR